MEEISTGWTMDVDRGPDWLFVRLHTPPPGADVEGRLAGQIWDLLQKQFAYRLVLELHDVPRLKSDWIGQLVLLHKRIHAQGGLLRLCGLSQEAREVVRVSGLQNCFPVYDDRAAAVMGHRPVQPR